MMQSAVPLAFRSSTRLSVGRDQFLKLIEIALDPLLLVLSQWAAAIWINGRLAPRDIILSVIVFSLTFPGVPRLHLRPWRALRQIAMSWLALSALLFLFGSASHYIDQFDPEFLGVWWVSSLIILCAAHLALRATAPAIVKLQGPSRRAIVAGMNEQGMELARSLSTDIYANVDMLGFFDDRATDRVNTGSDYSVLGKITDLADYVKTNHVDVLYLSLPMASQQRILMLLDALRDTTVSIYFVPDTFVTDLIQGRMDSAGGVSVVAVCETPLIGINRIIKRATDVVLSILILAMLSPILLVIALGIKMTSPGPVIFRQRRYGLDGSEIIVYKFRSMATMDDGAVVQQAKKADPRVTRLGAFLRKTSLDELPQFFNVLQGRMCIVGPRPHAVAHNEMYRKLIKGYMVRHKVPPGISGWAQINGCRGETETLEKMKARIDCDLEYLRNWSLRLDLYIIAKTIWVVARGENAH
jgi:putative colanic acid biosynthesis UDP-glucose lipid carrier transferase